METKICPNCKEELLEAKPRCKCGYKFIMLCEGCGRDVKGYSLCGECRVHGHKRCPDPRNVKDDGPVFDCLIDDDFESGDLDYIPHHPHYDWDCYDQYKRLQKLNKKAKNRREKL